MNTINYHISTEGLGDWGNMTPKQIELAEARYIEIARAELKSRIDEIDEIIEEEYSSTAHSHNQHFDQEEREIVANADAVCDQHWVEWLEKACEGL